MEDSNQKLLPISFSEEFLCGLESIDKDHRELFDQANSLLKMFLHCEPRNLVEESMQIFMKHLEEHFEDEEQHMQRAGYPQLSEHKEAHLRLLSEAQKLMTSFQEGYLSFGELHRFLSYTVVKDHLIDQDMDFHRFL